MNSHVGFAPGIFSTKQSLAHRTKRLSPPVFRCIEEGYSMPLTLRRADNPGSNYHVFAGTHSIMGKGGGMFRSTDNGDTWTEQNGGFTALDVHSVVINPIGHIFAGAAGGVFRSMNDADQWSDVSSGLLPPGGNVWAVATGGIASGGFAYALLWG